MHFIALKFPFYRNMSYNKIITKNVIIPTQHHLYICLSMYIHVAFLYYIINTNSTIFKKIQALNWIFQLEVPQLNLCFCGPGNYWKFLNSNSSEKTSRPLTLNVLHLIYVVILWENWNPLLLRCTSGILEFYLEGVVRHARIVTSYEYVHWIVFTLQNLLRIRIKFK